MSGSSLNQQTNTALTLWVTAACLYLMYTTKHRHSLTHKDIQVAASASWETTSHPLLTAIGRSYYMLVPIGCSNRLDDSIISNAAIYTLHSLPRRNTPSNTLSRQSLARARRRATSTSTLAVYAVWPSHW